MTIDVHCSIVTATVDGHFMIQLSSTPIVQGHQKRWTGFETAIT
jgi:hypothetical protein